MVRRASFDIAMRAPVLPPETAASAWPSFTAAMAMPMDVVLARRIAWLGFSVAAIASGVCTISIALGAAVPQIVIPFGHDQFDNAVRIEQLGVGRQMLKAKDAAALLRSAIVNMLQESTVHARCREVAPKADINESLRRVCEQIESDYAAQPLLRHNKHLTVTANGL